MGIFSNIFKKDTTPEEQIQASNRVLETLKRRRGEETGRWLNLLRDPSMIPKPPPKSTIEGVDTREAVDNEVYTPPVEAMYTPLSLDETEPALMRRAQSVEVQSPLVDWVNKFFQDFATQAAQFNLTASGTDLTLSVSPPEFSYEEAQYGSYSADKKISIFKGHIADLHWALLLQGNDKKIGIYILPSNELLALVKGDISETGYAPFMAMESSENEAGVEWSINGAVITDQAIPLLARELLGDLIRVSSGKMSETELFAHHHTELKLGDTVASGYTPAPAPTNESTSTAAGEAASSATSATGASASDTSATGTATLATFTACSELLKAIDQDLLALSEQEREFDEDKDHAALQRLHDFSARLRNLSGLASSLLADYQPGQGSKYRPS